MYEYVYRSLYTARESSVIERPHQPPPDPKRFRKDRTPQALIVEFIPLENKSTTISQIPEPQKSREMHFRSILRRASNPEPPAAALCKWAKTLPKATLPRQLCARAAQEPESFN